ncbi:MAG: PEP-CTERM sorting domain-containing protein [Akkermansiaceae bacterium]
MKPKTRCKFLPIISSAFFALMVSSHAAVVSWGTWVAVTDNTAIQTPTGFTYAGVNFNGSTTTINNGPGGTGGTDVTFTGIAPNDSGSAGLVTVASTGFNFQSTGNNSNVVSTVGSPQTWGTVLDRVIGDFDNSASFSLTGLASGTQYTVQFFSSAPDANILSNSKIASGGVDSPFFGAHVNGGTKYIVANFTADSGSQAFAITGSEPSYSALVIGTTVPEPSAALLGAIGLLGLLRRRRN